MSRHFWVLLHRYAGLYMAFFLVVAGLTGSILTFGEEIHEWLNLKPVPVRAQPMLDSVELREQAQALAPLGIINQIVFQGSKPDAPFITYVAPRNNPATGKPYPLDFNMLLLDPYTGEEISRYFDSNDLWPITRQNFISLVIALHFRLAIPSVVGSWLFGIAALIWTIDCFISAYLTFPVKMRRREVREASYAAISRKSWLSRWKTAWLVKWHGSTYRINFDLHRAGGLWVWLMLFVLAWSSVGLNLNSQVYKPVMETLFEMPKNSANQKSDKANPITDPKIGWTEAHQIAKQEMSSLAQHNGFKVARESVMYYFPERGAYSYFVDTDSAASSSSIIIDANNGKLIDTNLVSERTTGGLVNDWLMALHLARIWGLPYKIFECLLGLVVTMLSITGIYIWLKKRKARNFSREKHAQLVEEESGA